MLLMLQKSPTTPERDFVFPTSVSAHLQVSDCLSSFAQVNHASIQLQWILSDFPSLLGLEVKAFFVYNSLGGP